MTVGPVARNEASAAFFDGTTNGEFLLRRCAPHGHLSRPQARQCSECGSTELSWAPASGRARLVSWVVIPARDEADPPYPTQVPAIGELEEGPWWWSKLVGTDPDCLREGLPLRIAYDRADGHEAVPVFVLDTSR
jgi:uncharacterized protein